MTGTPLKELGFGDGLWPAPPYVAVKVPVFSFEKLNDVNAYLGPEMKSTGEVLGIGKDLRRPCSRGWPRRASMCARPCWRAAQACC